MKFKSRFIINSTVPCPFREVDSCSADQGVECLLWNLKVRYCVHKNPTLGTNLSNLNSVHTLILICLKAVYNTILPFKHLPVQQSLSHLTFCIDRKSLLLIVSLATDFNENELYRFWMFQVPISCPFSVV
jgi:hypothetical protein